MAIFLGKFSSNFPDQITQGYYQTNRINMFDSLDVNDYVFAIGNGIIQLWKAVEWIEISDVKRMNFEKIISNLAISTNQLIALKCFQLSKNLVIYSMRQGTRAFYQINLAEGFNFNNLLDPNYYLNQDNFRKIAVFSSRQDIGSSNDGNIILFKENGAWKINPNSFSEENVFAQFRDNSTLVNQGQRQKDATINKINGATFPKTFSPSELSIRSLYDAFCCDYKVNGQPLNIGLSRIYKISMSPNEISNEEYDYLIENNLVIVHEETPSKARSSTPQGENFTDDMNIGDYFYLTRGNNGIIVLGRVLSEAVRCEYGALGRNGWYQREYEILYESITERRYRGQKKWWTPNDNSTLIQIPPNEIALANNLIFQPFFAVNITTGQLENNNNTDKMSIPLNQILYGPPGTGKTHKTRNMSLEILGISCEGKEREEIVDIYKDHVESGQIVFTTFHQSMSYEDFIEGIKPLKPIKDTSIQYDIQEGIFKIACERAVDEIRDYLSLKSKNSPQPINLSFQEKYKLFVQALKEGKIVPETKTGLKVSLAHVSSSGNMHLSTSNSTMGYIISLKRLKKLVDNFPNPSSIQNVHDEIRAVIGGSHASLYYAALSAFVPFITSIEKESQEEGVELNLDNLKLSLLELKEIPKVVLIIDEINRGNVSAIFGELITLIEEDKRMGKLNELSAQLSYSKDKFLVPPNLYIIGTMNTADRSVEALDTALRRRFSFVEMLPDVDIIKNDGSNNGIVELEVHGGSSRVDLSEILTKMNQRIEVLVDRDHTIGHSYFLNIANSKDLKSAFQNKIIPLLQEYFYGNYSKMELVIGSKFFESSGSVKDITFAATSQEINVEQEKTYKLLNVTKFSDQEMSEALNSLINSK